MRTQGNWSAKAPSKSAKGSGPVCFSGVQLLPGSEHAPGSLSRGLQSGGESMQDCWTLHSPEMQNHLEPHSSLKGFFKSNRATQTSISDQSESGTAKTSRTSEPNSQHLCEESHLVGRGARPLGKPTAHYTSAHSAPHSSFLLVYEVGGSRGQLKDSSFCHSRDRQNEL